MTRLQHAVGLHQRGELRAAEAVYLEILGAEPGHWEALQLLGVVALQAGQWAAGAELIERSLSIEPRQAQAWSNLGDAQLQLGRMEVALQSYAHAAALSPQWVEVLSKQALVLRRLNRPEQALHCYERTLSIRPQDAEALNGCGNVLLSLGRAADALAHYERALALKPQFVEALYNRGNALRALDRPAEALSSYEQALSQQPQLAAAWSNRGNLLLALGRATDALASIERALELQGESADGWNSRGTALSQLQRWEEAVSSYEHALRLQPQHADAHNNRGNVLLELRREEEALASYDEALRLQPKFADAWSNRGTVLLKLRRLSDALDSYERALALKPESVDALNNRGHLRAELGQPALALEDFQRALAIQPGTANVLNNLGGLLTDQDRYAEAADVFARLLSIEPQFDYALGHLCRSRTLCCDWRDYEQNIARITAGLEQGRNVIKPFTLLGICDAPGLQLECARAFARQKYPAAPTPLWRGERYGHDKIRIAYLSADFHEHATAHLMAELFERHDRDRFDITAISFGPDMRDAMRERLQRAFDRFIDVRNLDHLSVAQQLRSLEIDIAVDLKGYTLGCRPEILAHRPAPVQVGWLGFPGTSGLDYIDYIIADPQLIPVEHRQHYSEQTVYLPECYQPNDSTRAIARDTPSRTAFGLPERGFVFCCFNNAYKITPAVFDVWMRLLREVPGSVLWLLSGHADVMENLWREAQQRGVEPERLVFAPRLPPDQHLARHRLADLFLDTLPYNAHTTASDALWAGLPVLTIRGNAFAGRVAASLLGAVGLEEMITSSLQEYESLAIALARDAQRLHALRKQLAERRSTAALFDAARFCRHLESAYVSMHDRNRAGLPPEALFVEAVHS